MSETQGGSGGRSARRRRLNRPASESGETRLSKGRTSVERVNARLKVFWGVDDFNLTGSRRFVAQVGVGFRGHHTQLLTAGEGLDSVSSWLD